MSDDNPAEGILGFLVELVSWIPFLLILSALGAASLTEEMFEYPDWVGTSVELYRGFAYPLVESFFEDVPNWAVDTALVGIGLLSLVFRLMSGFLISVIVFAILAAIAGYGGPNLFGEGSFFG